MDVSLYLKRIGYDGATDVSYETLRALHRAHLLSTPFENLDIHLGRPIVLEETRLLEKIVVQRRGGFCYELNGAFAWLLRSLGFEVDLLSAAVAKPDGGLDPPFDHMALAVKLDRTWLADVGFGDSFVEPLPLQAGLESVQEGSAYRVVATDDFPGHFPDQNTLMMERRKGQGDWNQEYLFSLDPYRLEDFSKMCEYHQTSPESMFTRKRTCSLAVDGGRVTLSGLRLIETAGDSRNEHQLSGADEARQVLLNRFGVDLSSTDVERLVANHAQVRDSD
jgi:N-hydroxyarylamine O-acetyltransferase